MKYQKLFSPIKIGKVEIKNRYSMAPMGPVGYSTHNGAYDQRLQDYYVERAKNNVGLIITGVTLAEWKLEGIVKSIIPSVTINPAAFIYSTYSMNERIHAYGAKSFLQISGGFGRVSMPGISSNPVSASDNKNRFEPEIQHREMTIEEIHELRDNFIKSAVIAKQAGFDGVEIHAVHEGYLLDQFTIAFYNRRNDEYGGSLENRLRLPIEIVKGIKKYCGEDFPVSLRFSLKSFTKDFGKGILPQEEAEEKGRDIEEGIKAAQMLEQAGYDALNADVGTYDSWYWNHPPMYFEDGMYRKYGKILKENVNIPVILAGRMDNPDIAEEAIDDSCDMIGLGRPLLADPEIVEKIRTDRYDEVRPCLSCHEGCMGRMGKAAISCAVNPACGREEIYAIHPATIKKTVLIIGSGPAGLESARVSAIRGHKVILVEKDSELGGNLRISGAPEFKRYDRALVNYYKRQLELLGVDIRLNEEVTKDNIESYKADEIIYAAGSKPKKIEIKGEQKTYPADEILLDINKAKENIVIVGGGLVGCETALWLTQHGKKVTIVEMLDQIAGGPKSLPFMNYQMLMELLAFNKVKIYTKSQVKESKKDSIVIANEDGEKEIKCDTLMTSVGYYAEDKLYNEIKDIKTPVHNIGDSRQVRKIMPSIWEAYEVCRTL